MRSLTMVALVISLTGCSPSPQSSFSVEPNEVIDLGALVTADLPERVWGKGLLAENGFDRPNSFDVIHHESEVGGGSVSVSNAYYTLFNHGGPHVDAPNHVGLEGGIDSYPVEAFVGPVKVFDMSRYPKGRSIPVEAFENQSVLPGDVVLIYTAYTPPETDDAFPETVTLTPEAAEYLANVPVRAYGTDAGSLGNLQAAPADGDTITSRLIPIHHAFLSRGIPAFEELFNVDTLLGKENMFFVGVPLNIENGDGIRCCGHRHYEGDRQCALFHISRLPTLTTGCRAAV